MKRILPLVLFVLVAAAAMASDVDLVVVMDTSESMFPYFEDLRNYLIEDLLEEKLHRGDTFHLLSFSGSPELETAVPLADERAAEKAFGRLALLHPLGRYTDLIAALRFVHQYVRQLPETNAKTVLLLTDGIHDPPPGSPNRLPPEEVRAAVRAAAEAIRREGWTVQVLKVPAELTAADKANGLPSTIDDIGAGLGITVIPYDPGRNAEVTGLLTGYPALAFPEPLGEVGRRFTVPLRLRNFSKDPILVRLAGAQIDHVEVLERPVEVAIPANSSGVLDARLRLPLSFPTGAQERELVLDLPAGLRISPMRGTVAFTYTGRGGLNLPRFNILYVVYLLLAAGAVYALVRLFLLMRRKLHEVSLAGLAKSSAGEPAVAARAQGSAPGRRPSRAGKPAAAAPVALARKQLIPIMKSGKRAPTVRAAAAARAARPTAASLRRSLPAVGRGPSTLPPLIEMRVSLQNSHVGFRNVHRVLPGTTRSIGGGASSYLVFITRVHRGIAEIRNEGGGYTFIPLASEYFPELSGTVKHCLGAEIPFTGPKGHRHTIVFREWVSSLDEINALMRSVRRD
ncbi:MAG: VWA domain-containing protein [Spirochaetes bacterium]|nr:VWA domain-containing protein [Spirochaetota bacterium]